MQNLADKIAEDASKEMAASIDFEVLTSFLVEDGWHKVEVRYFTDNKNAIDIYDWTEANSKDKFMKHGRSYVFKDAGDAINFTLKWL